MITASEINRRSGLIADKVAEIIKSDGVRNAVVLVNQPYAQDFPLAIRTPEGDEFGAETVDFCDIYKILLKQAKLQAKYALTAGGRSAQEQVKKLIKAQRNSSSYGVDFPPGFIPGYAIDKRTNLIVTVTSTDISGLDAAKVAENAIAEIDNGNFPEILGEAELVYACLELLKQDLPEDRTGFCMIAHPNYLDEEEGSKPLIFCSQSVGKVVSPANFEIVAAKTRAVVITGKPSRPDNLKVNPGVSQIEGAIPISIEGIGERVIAAGGLIEGKDDVSALVAAIESLDEKIGISLLAQLSEIKTDKI